MELTTIKELDDKEIKETVFGQTYINVTEEGRLEGKLIRSFSNRVNEKELDNKEIKETVVGQTYINVSVGQQEEECNGNTSRSS